MPTESPALSELLTLAVADRIDMTCDAFERQWIEGASPSLADWLASCLPGERAELFGELLQLEVYYRRKRGEVPSKSEYRERFPDFLGEVETLGLKPFGMTLADDGRTAQALSYVGKNHIGRFELLEKLGAGAAGEVWKARDPVLQRHVAVKIPHARQLSVEELRRFLREARAAAQLHHPLAVTVHEIGQQDDAVYIVSDWIDGVDLRRRLKVGPFSVSDATALCIALAEALHSFHEHGIVHRDLKPANIILDDRGAPHITDFGLAKWTKDAQALTRDGELLGTPAYMAPEQVRGATDQIGGHTDTYALGVVLYELLTGEPPFRGAEAAVFNAILQELPRSPRSLEKKVPRDLETICLKALAKEPARRYATAGDFAGDLRRFLRGEPIVARRASLAERAWRWMRRRPAIAGLLVLAMIAAASLIVAGGMAAKNRELLGLKTVSLSTQPPGAKVALVPLNPTTGEPIENEAIHVRGCTPVELDMRPGNYLVVVSLDDGSFHEVYRRVPDDELETPGGFNHLFWTRRGPSRFELPTIIIPKAIDVSRLQLVDNDVQAGRGGDETVAGAVDPFYIERTPFTYGDFLRRINSNQWPAHFRNDPPSLVAAMLVSFDEATWYAELLGMRVPSEREYRLAERQLTLDEGRDRGSRRPDVAQGRAASEGFPEWTTTWEFVRDNPQSSAGLSEFLSAHQYRVVWGAADAVPNAHSTPTIPGQERQRWIVPRQMARAVGFRCVRSVKPRFIP